MPTYTIPIYMDFANNDFFLWYFARFTNPIYSIQLYPTGFSRLGEAIFFIFLDTGINTGIPERFGVQPTDCREKKFGSWIVGLYFCTRNSVASVLCLLRQNSPPPTCHVD